MNENWNFSKAAFKTEEDGILSEIQIFTVIEKCILAEAEINNVLFYSSGISNCSLSYNFSNAIDKFKKKHHHVKVDVISIVQEYQIY